jgi:hypothetical protein
MSDEIHSYSAGVVLGGDGSRVSSFSAALVTGRGPTRGSVYAYGACAVISTLVGSSVTSYSAAIVTSPPPEIEVTYVTQIIEATGSDEEVIVPAGVTEIEFHLWGASGGAGQGYSPRGTLVSGGGSYVSGRLAVAEDDVLSFDVGLGGQGATGDAIGIGGYPDGLDGTYDRQHDSYQGGQGGSTTLRLNGVLVARAGGSLGTKGYPAGLSAVGADATYLHTSVIDPLVNLAENTNVSAGASEATQFGIGKVGWGVLNPDPDEPSVNGTSGAGYVQWVTP